MNHQPILVRLLAFGLLLAGVLGPAPTASASPLGQTFTVNATVDGTDKTPGNGVCETDTGNGVCTLRAAVMEANAWIGPDTIVVPADNFTLTLSGAPEDSAVTGDLDITSDLTINGAGAANTIIQWGPNAPQASRDRVFDILGDVTVHISGVTIRNGYTDTPPYPYGGGIRALGGNLTVLHSVLSNNTAERAGAIYAQAALTLSDDVITDNNATDGGAGGIWALDTATLIDDTISGNSAAFGGGMVNSGTLTAINLTLSGNWTWASQSGYGGGLLNGTTATLINSTFSGNRARVSGGGISNTSGSNPSLLKLYNVTVTGNTADYDSDGVGDGGGLSVIANSTVQVSNSLIAKNFDASPSLPAQFRSHDCMGPVTSGGYNLLGTIVGCDGLTNGQNGDKVGTGLLPLNPLLGPLAANGGATLTHALLAGSPAIDTGNPAGCAAGLNQSLTTDQRGFARPAGVRCDMGSFEYTPASYQVFVPLVSR